MYKSVSHSVVSDSLWPGLDYSPPGSSVHGILQARILEWVAIPLSRGSSQPRDWNLGSHIAGKCFIIWVTREAHVYISYIAYMYFICKYICFYTAYVEKAMAPHSSTLAWKIPWAEEPGRLQSMGSLSQTRLSDFTFTFLFHALEKEMATHSSVLAWRIPGIGEPGGLPSMGSHRVGHDWNDLAYSICGIYIYVIYLVNLKCFRNINSRQYQCI